MKLSLAAAVVTAARSSLAFVQSPSAPRGLGSRLLAVDTQEKVAINGAAPEADVFQAARAEEEEEEPEPLVGYGSGPLEMNGVTTNGVKPEDEGLPWWWEYLFELPAFQTTPQGTECQFGDSANVLRTNIEQIYGGFPSLDGAPLAEGEITDIAEGTMFIGLQRYADKYGSPYKLCFGPKSFL
ncbi:hypothetical protein THAOC_35330 [Thalassiosira oceanica]|uniref:Uncharacterized protein n=1 Tax=Thalassiosira oceanica TaxID=159749 RepID=K0RAE4_THAOC|nr:hypothetical protein THAOC_35330 [Thalassiosira oceanica]|eukprot:EJK46026.1 hypothetical protein THAOC_35330 [Thalassiosira oceanica]